MVRNLLVVLTISCLLACSQSSKKTSEINKKIHEITVETKADTLSYALGLVWAYNLTSAGISNLSYTFYNGVQDYLNGDTIMMGINRVNYYLDSHRDIMKVYNWPISDTNTFFSQLQLTTMADTFSYAVGFVWSRGTAKFGLKQIEPSVIKGFYDGLKQDSSLFTQSLAEKYLSSQIANLREDKYAEIKNRNTIWLEENKSKEGIKLTSSGLQYKIITSGKGKKSSDEDIFECHYIGKLIDGTQFENTYKASKADRFYLSAMKPGMIEALLLMHEGDKWEIFVPADLAFGSGGISNRVPPFSTVIYEIELVKLSSAQ